MTQKITVLEQKTFNNKPSGFKVTFDDGRNGNMNEKESDKGLRVGDNVIVTEIPYTSKAGVTSTLYGVRLVQGATVPPPPPVSQPPKSATFISDNALPTESTSKMKYETRVPLMRLVIEAMIAGKIEQKEVKEWYTELVSMMDGSIDEIRV
jgi:hypothetical protein